MRAIFLLCLLLLSLSTMAQTTNKELTLSEAIAISLKESNAIKAATYKTMAATNNRRAAIGLRAPQINLTGSFVHTNSDIAIDVNHLKSTLGNAAQQIIDQGVAEGLISPTMAEQIQGVTKQLTSIDWSYKLQDRNFGFIGGDISLPIYTGGKINIANRVARFEENLSQEQSIELRNATISQMVEYYFGLQLAHQVRKVRQQAVDGIQRHLSDAIALHNQGMIAQSEMLYVEYELAKAKQQLDDATLQVSNIESAILTALHQKEGFIPTTEMFYLDNIENVAYFKSLSLNHNPSLNQLHIESHLAEENIALQRADFLPQVVAMMGGNIYRHKVSHLVPRWAVGVGVNMKIFDGLSREHKYQAAKLNLRQVQQLELEAQDEITLLVETLYNQTKSHLNKIFASQAAIKFAAEYLRIKRIAFADGWATATELIDAELELAKAEIEMLQAAYFYDTTLAKLLETAGISDEYPAYTSSPNSHSIGFSQDF